MPVTRILHNPDHSEHDTGPGHPERADRIEAVVNQLRRTRFDPAPDWVVAPEADRRWLESVHQPAHVAAVEAACRDGVSHLDGGDTRIAPGSFRAARRAVGGGLAAADAVIGGAATNALVLARPPGHHADAKAAMGFCLFNNVAVTARYLQGAHGLGPILIVDWDVHHGNGTQDIFRDDPSVFFFSVHQWPLYPGTGPADDVGAGRGRGATRNVPLAAGQGDDIYRQVFREQLGPLVERFRPEAILISAGFDAHECDPLGGMRVTDAGFGDLTRTVVAWAAEFAGGRLISFLEGGYDTAALARSVEAHLGALVAAPSP